MHSHTRGEKIENIKRNEKAGFEVDRELEFLPSYFEDPKDASLADTLYVSIVMKGNISLVTDKQEKTLALNALMKKYQPEGGYDPINPEMKVRIRFSLMPENIRAILEPNTSTIKERLDAINKFKF